LGLSVFPPPLFDGSHLIWVLVSLLVCVESSVFMIWLRLGHSFPEGFGLVSVGGTEEEREGLTVPDTELTVPVVPGAWEAERLLLTIAWVGAIVAQGGWGLFPTQ